MEMLKQLARRMAVVVWSGNPSARGAGSRVVIVSTG
jgi:hypothetical protein